MPLGYLAVIIQHLLPLLYALGLRTPKGWRSTSVSMRISTPANRENQVRNTFRGLTKKTIPMKAEGVWASANRPTKHC